MFKVEACSNDFFLSSKLGIQMIALSDIVLIAAISLVLMYWWQTRGLKEIAYQNARAHCAKMGVELLDQAVFLRKFWFKRDDNGTLKGWRSYYFEFTTDGETRYMGRIILLGPQVTHIELEPHRLN